LLRQTRFQVEQRVERVEFEEVTMRLAGRWTRTAVTEAAKIVQTLLRTARKVLRLGRVLGKFCRGWRPIEQHPMYPRADGRVGIISDKCETFRGWRRAGPFERRRNVETVAGVFLGNRLAFRESRARKLKVHGLILGVCRFLFRSIC